MATQPIYLLSTGALPAKLIEEAAAKVEEEIQREAGRIAESAALDDGPVLRGRLVWLLTG